MNGNMFTWYLKERLLKAKQIIVHVGDSPKKPTTRDKTEPLGSQKEEHESEQHKVTGLGYFVMPLGTKNLVSTCVIASKIIRWSSCLKWIINVKMINAQHPKNAKAIVQITKGKPSLPKKARMAWQWVGWQIEPPKDPTPNNFSNIIMVWISNLI